MNNELLAWPLNLVVARRPKETLEYSLFNSMYQEIIQKQKMCDFLNCLLFSLLTSISIHLSNNL